MVEHLLTLPLLYEMIFWLQLLFQAIEDGFCRILYEAVAPKFEYQANARGENDQESYYSIHPIQEIWSFE